MESLQPLPWFVGLPHKVWSRTILPYWTLLSQATPAHGGDWYRRGGGVGYATVQRDQLCESLACIENYYDAIIIIPLPVKETENGYCTPFCTMLCCQPKSILAILMLSAARLFLLKCFRAPKSTSFKVVLKCHVLSILLQFLLHSGWITKRKLSLHRIYFCCSRLYTLRTSLVARYIADLRLH